MSEVRLLHLSVVSHRQGELVRSLMSDLARCCQQILLRVTVTINVPEDHGIDPGDYPFPVSILENPRPQGFGTNHNCAFRHGLAAGFGGWFCVINPDVRVNQDVFGPLIHVLAETPAAGIVAPRVVNRAGATEDSARRFPQPWTPVRRAVCRASPREVVTEKQRFYPDWVAGMFMLFPYEVFHELGGFDERYFLYYEDVELCGRVWLSGRCVVVEPSVAILHDARRDSHRKFRYLLWHIRGVLRFFTSATYWRLTLRGVPGRRRTTG